MFMVHFLDTDAYAFAEPEREEIVATARRAEDAVRPLLRLLDSRINVTVEPSSQVIPEVGVGAFTPSRHLIQIRLDPARDEPLEEILDAHLFPTIAHEACHAARYVGCPIEPWDPRPIAIAVFEGLATVFETEVTGRMPPWGAYDEAVIDSWVDELVALAPGTDSRPWRFHHPDGRRWIAYRAGTRIIETVCRARSTTVPDLLDLTTDEILEAGGLHPVAPPAR